MILHPTDPTSSDPAPATGQAQAAIHGEDKPLSLDAPPRMDDSRQPPAITGNTPFRCLGDEAWRASLSSTQRRHLHHLFSSLEWWRLEPAHALLSTSTEFPHPAFAKSEAGDCAVCYLPAQARAVLDLSACPGRMEVQWFQPLDGTIAATGEEFPHLPCQKLQPPDPGRDWVLLLRAKKPRLLILTDIGGDPDDQQSLIRLLLYANEFRLEGFLASASGTPGELRESIVRPDLIREIVNAYGQVRPHLLTHATGWPTREDLLDRVKSGNPLRGREHIGEHHDTEGSRWIVHCAEAGSPEDPLNIAIWGGQTDFAQALWRVRQDRGADGLAALTKKIRVYDIGNQDRIADWMRTEFPGLHYILAGAPEGADKRLGTYRGVYLGGDSSLTSRAWIETHVRSKGPLGALYPVRTWTDPNPHGCMKEGDTPSWFFFLPRGGNHPDNPEHPGWGGQFRREPDGWYRDFPLTEGFDPRAAVARWRPHFQADFARRMAWCVA